MNQVETIPSYPEGIEYRPPRPRRALLGSLVETIFPEKTNGTLGSRPVDLPEAVRRAFAEKGFESARFHRLGRFGAKAVFKYGDTYVLLESHAPQTPEMSLEQIEDWLYGDLTENKFNEFIQKFSHRIAR